MRISRLASEYKTILTVQNRPLKASYCCKFWQDLYPDGHPGLSEGVGNASWRIPGANFILKDDQLNEILIYELPKGNRTR